MLFKVYAKNIARPRGMRIVKVSKLELEAAIEDVFNCADNMGMLDYIVSDHIDYSKMEGYYDKIRDYFETNKFLDAGDYRIVETDDAAKIKVPNICGNDAFLIFN